MRASSLVTWKKPPQLPGHRLPACKYGLVTIDKRQGLQKTREAKAFRRKRSQTQYIQPHGLAEVVQRYLDCPSGTFPWFLAQLDSGEMPACPAIVQVWEELIGQIAPCFDSPVKRAAFAILWIAIRGEGIPNMLATTFAEAAGLEGRQQWALVLSSSARVSQVTYQTVVGVRYPELVEPTPTGCRFGRFVTEQEPLRGGCLPLFWDVPQSNMHAVGDIGAVVEWLFATNKFRPDAKSRLAILHNRNNMVNLFKASCWVTNSMDSVVSRGVTTCAGMTAHTVIVAQTRVGFLTGRRKQSFRDLPQEEQLVQLEEAFARATVAITRARSLCIIMGPLDMKGLLGAATVVGALMYGGGCGPDLLTSTCMTALFKVHRLMLSSYRCSLQTVA